MRMRRGVRCTSSGCIPTFTGRVYREEDFMVVAEITDKVIQIAAY